MMGTDAIWIGVDSVYINGKRISEPMNMEPEPDNTAPDAQLVEDDASLKKIMAEALRESTVVIARGYTDAEIEAIKAEARRAMKERCAQKCEEIGAITSVPLVFRGLAEAIRALPDAALGEEK